MTRRLLTFALGLVALLVPLALAVPAAEASHSQVALFQDDGALLRDPAGTMAQLRLLGVGEARVYVEWSFVAPNAYGTTKPAHFNSASPAGYTWTRYDNIIAAAKANHIKLDFLLSGGAPRWAFAPGFPGASKSVIHYAWKPSVTEWGNFVHAALVRFGGSIHSWEIFNEPNFGDDLAPQSVHGVATGPAMYRQLVDAAWRQFIATHHTHDTIVVGQITARGLSGGSLPGNFSQTKPLIFTRDLYCVDRSLHPLKGSAAKHIGCPTTAAASRSFTRLHPGLFNSSGFGIHPYPQGLPPTRDSSRDPDYVTFNTIPRMEATLDGIDRTYHHRGGFPLYNNEYGYVTHPPAVNRIFASPQNAATYLNQAEYLSWLNPRIATTMQYLLYDPPNNGSTQFFSGLIDPSGHVKASWITYRMPLWLPSPVTRRGHTTEVWADVRPAHVYGGRQVATIQWRKNASSAFRKVASVTLRASNGYFDTHVRLPGSGQVQVVWNQPHVGLIGSRITNVTVR